MKLVGWFGAYLVALYCCVLPADQGRAPSSRIRVAVVHSYPPGEWYHGIQKALEKNSRELSLNLQFYPVVFHSEFWLRRPAEELLEEKKRVVAKIHALQAQAVILCDDEAADAFAVDLTTQKIPLFVTGVNREIQTIPWWEHIQNRAALVLEQYPVETLFQTARRLFPRAKTLGLITGKNPSSQIIYERFQKQVPLANQRLGTRPFILAKTLLSDSWQQWKEFLSQAHTQVDLVWLLVPYDVRDAHGTEVSMDRMSHWMALHLKVPSLGLSTIHPKMGVVLTVAVGPEQLAKATLQQMRLWLGGRPFSEIAVRALREGQLHLNLESSERLKVSIPKDVISVSRITTSVELPYGR